MKPDQAVGEAECPLPLTVSVAVVRGPQFTSWCLVQLCRLPPVAHSGGPALARGRPVRGMSRLTRGWPLSTC